MIWRARGRLLLLALLPLLVLPGLARAQSDPMRAPSQEELDRQSDEWIGRRRWMAILIISGTLVAGGAGSVMRRRARRQAMATPDPAAEWPPTQTIRALDPPLRMDRLRKALRAGLTPPAPELEALARLFREDAQPPLRVLLLEALSAGDRAVDRDLLQTALADPADSVRAAAAHLLLAADPGLQIGFAREHLHDPGLELRTLCAEILAGEDPRAAGEAMLDLVRAEALGPRESHALRRAMGFFAEDLRDPAWADRIAALREEVGDEEGMIDWALDRLQEEQPGA